MVEAGGIEPPSENPTRQDLHAYPNLCSRSGLPDGQGKPKTSSVLFSQPLPETRTASDPVIVTLFPSAQTRIGTE